MAARNHDQDNRTNSLTEHHMHTAVEAVLSNPEQSYEEFMACFINLKKEDIVGYYENQIHTNMSIEDGINMQVHQHPEVSTVGRGSPPRRQMETFSDQEDIEEEELDEGYYAPTRLSTELPPGHKFLQMDNFVDDADLEDEPEEQNNEDSQYEPSFEIVNSSAATYQLEHSKDIVRRLEETVQEHAETSNASESRLKAGRGFEVQILPGEADNISRSSLESEGGVRQTELAMSTRLRHTELTSREEVHEAVAFPKSNDEVQPFSLDADFDYDNVVLTPKWDSDHQITDV